MEKTGVIFTEKAWKDFLDFMKEVKSPGDTEEQETDQFVDAYYKQQKAAAPQKQRTAGEAEKLYNDIYSVLFHADGSMTGVDIRNHLEAYGHTDINPKGFSSVMTSAMKQHPEIIRPSRGAYELAEEMPEDDSDESAD